MTPKQAKTILIESLSHVPETRVDYFRNKAKEFDIEPDSLIMALQEGYKQLYRDTNKHVIGSSSEVDQITGKVTYYKEPISLDEFGFRGYLSNKEVEENLAPTLFMYVSAVQSGKIDSMRKKIKKHLKKNHEPIENLLSEKQKINWNGTPTQLYWIFGQVKQKMYSDNSYKEIAEFIHANFNGIKASVRTIEREIQKLANGEKIVKVKGSIDLPDKM